MTVLIEVDTRSPVPAYEQIRAQVTTMVASGVMPVGTPLPPIRQLAADLGLAANTVARAYHELESAGIVISRRRSGTVIADIDVPWLSDTETFRRLDEAAAAYALICRQLDISPDAALDAVRAQLAR